MDEKEAVLQADDGFFAGLRAMFAGDLEPIKALWSHGDDVVYMGPDKRMLIGWKAVLPDWEKQAEMKMGGDIEVVDRHATVGAGLAVVHHLARVSNAPGGGDAFDLRGTNVFRLEDGQWKLIAHHSDPLPYL